MYQVKAGDIHENPVTGEIVTVIDAPSDTNGRRPIVEGIVCPSGAVAAIRMGWNLTPGTK